MMNKLRMRKQCDIVIPVYNATEWLELCIESIYLSDVSACVSRVIIVDDCSGEPTKQMINNMANEHEGILVITNEENLGFVQTCNKGMKASTSEYIMLLNSDCLLAEDSIKKLIDILSDDPQIGLISPLSNNAATISIDMPADYDYIAFDKLLETYFSKISFNACTIIGSCLMITRDCYKSTGELDEVYGLGYGEETDYQFRAKQLGFRAVIAIDTYVFHKSEMSFKYVAGLSFIKKKNSDLFHSRWGKEYRKDFRKYRRNDPVKYVYNNLSENDYKVFSDYRSRVFSEKFLEKVAMLDRKNRDTKSFAESGGYSSGKLFFRAKLLARKTREMYKKEGLKYLIGKIIKYISEKTGLYYLERKKTAFYKDFAFISDRKTDEKRAFGYVEILGYFNVSADPIDINSPDMSYIKRYRGFVFIDCDYGETAGTIITEAKKLNKSVFWVCSDEGILSQLDEVAVDGVLTTSKRVAELATGKGFSAHTIKESFIESALIERSSFKTGFALKAFLSDKLNSNIAFILPSTVVCGGMNVVVKHSEVLQKNGYDVFIINMDLNEESVFYKGREIPVVSSEMTGIECMLDNVVSTMWTTIECMDEFREAGCKYYLVQGFETDFYGYKDSGGRKLANSTYARNDIVYMTVSQWCRKWLKDYFQHETRFIRNGIDISEFKKVERDYSSRITILIEGDCGAEYKNIDESFTVTNKLDREKYEIIYLTNRSMPKKWYQYDKLYHKIPYEEVAAVYESAHILLKTSLFESFSYPLLEMMATGGIVIAIQNEGNSEFAINDHNCLIYRQGDISEAIRKIEAVSSDGQLRDKLIANGLETAKARAWENIEAEILRAYSGG